MIKNSLIYILADIVNKGLVFLLLPFFTELLTTEEFALYVNSIATIQISSIIFGLGGVTILNNIYFTDRKNFSKYLWTIFSISGFAFCLVGSILMVLFNNYSGTILGFSSHQILLFTFCGLVVALLNGYMKYFVLSERVLSYGKVRLVKSLIDISLTLVCALYVFESEWISRSVGMLLSGIFILVVFHIIVRGELGFVMPETPVIRAVLKVGIPILPHQISLWLKLYGDKLFLTFFLPLSTIGLYNYGFQITSISFFIVSAINQVLAPRMFRQLSIKDTVNIWSLYEVKIFVVSVFIVLSLTGVLIPFVQEHLISSRFEISYFCISGLLFGFFMKGLYFVPANYLVYKKKTFDISFISIVTMIFHLVLLYVFSNTLWIYWVFGASESLAFVLAVKQSRATK